MPSAKCIIPHSHQIATPYGKIFAKKSKEKRKKMIDKPASVWYSIQAVERRQNARVVELADSLDSGSSVHYARAGSSPASRTKLDKSCV